MSSVRFSILLLFIIFIGMLFFSINLLTGYENIRILDFLYSQDDTHKLIISYRLHKTIAAVLAGISLPVSGFLMQELFKNPLAGPSVLGISSAAALSVGLVIFLGIPHFFESYEWLNGWIIILSALAGALAVSFLLLIISKGIKEVSAFIIVGFLISSFCGSVISALQFYSQSENLKQYVIWSFGSFEGLTAVQIAVYSISVAVGLVFAFLSVKMLIGFLMGEGYARVLGINISILKILVILSVSFLAGSTTAMLGPIVFIGIIIPHFCRMVWNPSLLWKQVILNIFIGIVFMLILQFIISNTQLPINILSSVIGIPVILFMIFKNKFRNTI